MTTTANPHEDAARARKVAHLVGTLHAANTTHRTALELADLAEQAPPAWWAALARSAGVRPPSPATVAQVVATLRATTADPFDGL